jgi:hypothetical protein
VTASRRGEGVGGGVGRLGLGFCQSRPRGVTQEREGKS